jgi:hypothetical protein
MSSIFGGGSSTSADMTPSKGKQKRWSERERESNIELTFGVNADLNARKEAVMASVRNELALANAQELMNVRAFFICFSFLALRFT